MNNEYQKGNEKAVPDIQSFNLLIKAWAMSDRPEAPEMAEDILRRMQHLEAQIPITPNVVTYTTIMLAYGKSKRKDAALKAENLLLELERDFRAGKVSDGPNQTTFETLRKAWLTSQDPKRVVKVEEIDTEIRQRFGADDRE
jgi:hypothetical protein